METSTNQEITGICTVTAMARQIGLSRARFYELLAQGAFPPPLYSLRTQRPFFTPDQQRKCLEIRRTGIGLGGQPVVFSAPRKKGASEGLPDVDYDELTRILRRMELAVTKRHVRKAIAEVYPKGLPQGATDESVIRDLYLYFLKARQICAR